MFPHAVLCHRLLHDVVVLDARLLFNYNSLFRVRTFRCICVRLLLSLIQIREDLRLAKIFICANLLWHVEDAVILTYIHILLQISKFWIVVLVDNARLGQLRIIDVHEAVVVHWQVDLRIRRSRVLVCVQVNGLSFYLILEQFSSIIIRRVNDLLNRAISLVQQTVADAIYYETVDLILVINDHTTTRINWHGHNFVRWRWIARLLLWVAGTNHTIERPGENSGQILRLIVGCIVNIEILRVGRTISSDFAAEFHARQWTRRLILALRLLDRWCQILGTRLYLLVINLLNIRRHVEVLVRLVGEN